MSVTKHDLSDPNVTYPLARRLLDLGYYAVPTCAKGGGKSWIVPQGPSSYPTHEPRPDGQAPDRAYVERIFQDNPGCGISVATPFLRPPHQNDLLVLDVDIEDPAVLPVVALIIGSPCPVRVGQKGAAFFCRYPAMKTIPGILRERSVPPPDWAKACSLVIPAYKSETFKAIDLLGLKNAHILIPPTVHMGASQRLGYPVEYKWVEFPGTSMVLRLEETSPRDLPELEPYHLILLFQWAKNPTSAIWKYLGKSSPGDHHALMLAATTYMWHERFTMEEIEAICIAEAERSAESDEKLQARIKEIQTAVRTLQVRMPEQKPAKLTGQVSKARIPLDRMIADSLVEQYGLDNLASFDLVVHHWDKFRWRPLQQLDHPSQPWHEIYRQIMREYPIANNSAAVQAIKAFGSCIPTRKAAPNHDYIPFRNGLLDVHSLRLRPMERDDFILHSIPWDWDPDAKAPLWERFLNHLFEPPLEFHEEEPELRVEDRIRSINAAEEFFGYCLTRSHAFQRMLYVIGKPNTGKSVLFKVLKGILPEKWMSTVALDAFGDANSRMQMVNSYINVASEVGRRSKDVDDILLRVTAGEDVEVKVLYSNKVQAVLPTRLVFQGNLPPDSTDGTGAIQRRILMLRTTDTPPEKKVENFERMLIKEAPGILRRLAIAYARLLERGDFLAPHYAAEITQKMKTESNSALLWIDMRCNSVENTLEGSVNEELFRDYIEFCESANLYKLSLVQWGKHLTGAGFPSYRKRLPGSNYGYVRRLVLKNIMTRGISY